MSFSKAKIKRFNDIPVVESPSSERKDHIKKFLKDIRESCKDSMKDKEAKEPKEPKEPKNVPSTPSVSDAESLKSSRSLRLFRTPSLPKRLRFRQNSDITPKKELQKDLLREKEALEAANVEIKNKSEVLKDYELQLDELKAQIFQYKENETKQKSETESILTMKNDMIATLTKEIEELKVNKTSWTLEKDELTSKIDELENEIKTLLKTHDNEISFLIGTKAEVEVSRDKLLLENDQLLKETKSLKDELDATSNELSILKTVVQSNDGDILTKNIEIEKLSAQNACLCEEVTSLKKKIEDDVFAYAEESQNMLNEINNLKTEKTKLSSELTNSLELIKALQEELADKDIELDSQRDSVRDTFQDEIKSIHKKYEQQIATLKELSDMKIKEFESIHVLEVSKMARDHQQEMQLLEHRKKEEINRINESIEEKIKIAEIQQEQKYRGLEMNLKDNIQREKHHWQSEIDKCQKIAETEIIQIELEKQDLKTLLESANEMLRERDDKIKNLESKLSNGIEYYINLNEKLESELQEVKQECARIMTEKYNYQLTLNNTRSTVNILMDRLKKSDTDVETLKVELDNVCRCKLELETKNSNLENDLKNVRNELEEYRNALINLRSSSQALEREMKEKETVFEKLMSSEEETLETVSKIGKFFNEKIEENVHKYSEMYTDLKRKYESRETYIEDMKALLDEFATGIELARIELDAKDKHLLDLEQENKDIKLHNMTLRYKCEQFEESQKNENYDVISGNRTMAILSSNSDFDNKLSSEKPNNLDTTNSISTKRMAEENQKLKLKLSEQIKRNDLLQEMIALESENAVQNSELKKKINKIETALKNAENMARENSEKYNELKNQNVASHNVKNMENLRDTNAHLKNKIAQLQLVNKEQEATISELQEKINGDTPRKTIPTKKVSGTPRTPKTPKSLLSSFAAGKENRSPTIAEVVKSPKGVLKPRN